MESGISPAIDKAARELDLSIYFDSLHGAQGVELRRKIDDTDTVLCIGYYVHDLETIKIYRRIDSARHILWRNKLWFLWGWLIRPRVPNNQYAVLRVMPVSEFNERLFIDIAKQEIGSSRRN